MTNKITDWEVELGFNTRKVDKGLKDLDKKFKKFNSKLNLTLNTKVGGGGGSGGSKASGGGYGFGSPSTGIRKLSLEQRFVQNQNIDRAIAATNAGINALRGNQDKDAIDITKRLTEEKKRLLIAQKSLTSVTFSNTPAYVKLKHAMVDSRTNIRGLTKEIKELTRTTQKANPIMSGFRNSLKSFVVASVSAFAIANLGRSIFDTTKKMDSLRASMLAASGSSEQASEDFKFIRQTAIGLGRDLFTSAKGFQQIGTAMRAAGFEGDQIKEIFLAASEASTAFGLSSEDTAGVMRAFSQIASKGSVQAEELRGQLGDRLFGAFQEAAKAMGVTTDELNKMLKAGQVGSDKFLPKFAKQLRKTVRETGALSAGLNTVVAAQNRFKTSLTDLSIANADAGLKNVFIDSFKILKMLTKAITPLTAGISSVLEPIFATTRGVFELVGAIAEIGSVTFDGFAQLGTDIDEANKKLTITQRIMMTISGLFDILLATFQQTSEGIGRFFTSVNKDHVGLTNSFVSEATKQAASTGNSTNTTNTKQVTNHNEFSLTLTDLLGDPHDAAQMVKDFINDAMPED